MSISISRKSEEIWMSYNITCLKSIQQTRVLFSSFSILRAFIHEESLTVSEFPPGFIQDRPNFHCCWESPTGDRLKNPSDRLKNLYIVETFKSSRMQDIKDKGRVNHVTVKKKYIKKLLRSCKRKRKTRKENAVIAEQEQKQLLLALHT